jgi:hypothetical protein
MMTAAKEGYKQAYALIIAAPTTIIYMGLKFVHFVIAGNTPFG